MADVCRVDVGGVVFTSSAQSLRKSPFLAAQLRAADDGIPFIDRDPTVFQAVLTYLRYGAIGQIDDPHFCHFLSLDADYYQLPGLKALLE